MALKETEGISDIEELNRILEKAVTLKGERIAEEFQALVDEYVQKNYAAGGARKARTRKKEIPIKVVA